MDRERILAVLREHQQMLNAAGIEHLRLFGSAARGESTVMSDIDLLADLDYSKPFTLLRMAQLEYQLDDLLGQKVDLSSADLLHPRVSRRALEEAIVAF